MIVLQSRPTKTIMMILLSLVAANTACRDITNMSGEELKKHVIRLDGRGAKILTGDGPQPLWIVNDDTVSMAFIKRLKPKYITTISVTKPDSAQILYGSAAKNGVIKIQAREAAFSDFKPLTDDSCKKQSNR